MARLRIARPAPTCVAMPRKFQPGLPNRDQVLEFIKGSKEPAGKREIARAFGLKGQERVALKALLRDMADEGLIDGEKRAFHRMGGVPKVTVLRVVDVEEGEAIAIPDAWSPDSGLGWLWVRPAMTSARPWPAIVE